MKKVVLLVLLLVVSITLHSQEYKTADNFKFKLIKAKKAVGGNYYYTIRTSKEEKKVQVRFKMKSLSGKKTDFDPNKFYLVSDSYKWRIRPIDVRHNFGVGMIYIGFEFLVDFKPIDKKLKDLVFYKPEIKNTFYDFKIDGYKDVYPTINFGTKRKPKIVKPYLNHKKLKSCKIDLYFSLPKDLKKLKIYYGNTLITDTKLE